jgi:hypothetical protein
MTAQSSFFCQQCNNVLLDNIDCWLIDGKGEMLEKHLMSLSMEKFSFLILVSYLRIEALNFSKIVSWNSKVCGLNRKRFQFPIMDN